MVTEGPDRKVNTNIPDGNDGEKRLPHERDESPKGTDTDPRGIMKQAASDVAQGLVDTDMHGERGLEGTLNNGTSGQAVPQKDAADGMRLHNPVTPANNKQ